MNKSHYLDKIIFRKEQEVATLLKNIQNETYHPLNIAIQKNNISTGLFASGLKRNELAIIAEIKRKSPSRGEINPISNPRNLALEYCEGGAAAISVLTDFIGFGGTLSDLQQVSEKLKFSYPTVPTLRKDFIVHPIQLAEAVNAGANSVLLIACTLKKDLGFFIREATRLGLETLTEIHDLDDLALALDAKSPIIGVNHRNLKTFEIDLSLSEKIRPFIPSNIITVAESGIYTAEQAQLMKNIGYDAILIGEALVSSSSPSRLIKNMRGVNNAS